MTLLTAAKAGGGAVAAAGIPASIYFAHNYMTSLYEVENKVINEQVGFTITNGESSSKTIKVASANTSEGTTWNENDGYWWECTVSWTSTLSSISSSLSSKLPSSATDSDATKLSNKKALVQKCSENREESTNKKVKAKFIFKDDVSDSNWETYLFGETNSK